MDFIVYLVCLGAGLVFTLVSAIAGHLFGGHEGHVDGSGGHAEAGADMSDMPGVSAFSPTVLASFVMAFGGFGIIFHQIPATRSPWFSAPLALLGGFIMSAVLLWLLRQLFRKTQSSSESKVASLAGLIAYVQAGTRYTAPARAENGVAIAAGQSVKITRVVGSQFYVTQA
jgi:hypothetical protein